MNKSLLTALTLALGCAQFAGATVNSSVFLPAGFADRTVCFNPQAQGERFPILWGLDTAWPSEENIVRGVRFMGSDIIGVARVSFQPFDFLSDTWQLTPRLEDNLRERLRLVSLIGGPSQVKLVLNNDAPGELFDTRYLNAGKDPVAARAYANLIYGTYKSCVEKGWDVITASPLNEPDFIWNNQGSKADFYAIAKELKSNYPEFADGSVRISGGNTLNCDSALTWYEYLYDFIDEGNTHQLAGDFDHYADFFTRVAADGKYPTADELHNIMEAMVGVEYGMKTGIWWGTAEYSRGQFCRASNGYRLAYSENRPAWSSAAVYRNPSGNLQAFCGTSERQAAESSFRFVCTDGEMFFDGYGPTREYLVELPGGTGYQEGQTNAECAVNITNGTDVQPYIDGTYRVMNKFTGKVLAADGSLADRVALVQQSKGSNDMQLWKVNPVSNRIGGDFSYHSFVAAANNDMKLDVLNWALGNGGEIILFNGGMGNNEQWRLDYAGDGYFRIVSRHSALCLEVTGDDEGARVLQAAPSNSSTQLWRFIAPDAPCETERPDAPTGLAVVDNVVSALLSWQPSPSYDVATYTIYRAIVGTDGKTGKFNTIARGVEGTSFIDNTISPDLQYAYKVVAVDGSLNISDPTSEVFLAERATGKVLVAHYLMNGDLLDATPNAFHAASNALYGEGRDAASKEAFSVHGSKWLQLPYTVVPGNEFTIAMWFKKGRGAKYTSPLISLGAGSGEEIYVVPNANGNVACGIRHDGVENSFEALPIPVGEWVHVALCCGRDEMTLYVNGEYTGGMISDIAPADVKPFLNYIGRSQDEEGEGINGYIDDLCVFNYALSPEEVRVAMVDPESGIGTAAIADNSPVVAREYYTPAGLRVATPVPGSLYIVRSIYADGRVSAGKFLAE